ncbi:hypothetical protein CS022_00550 [Veronia nyctiphanis]|uniref:VOC family protein n=1 Tax=Veronia nyctiphanis TaxID=1278244 RepID=A0A4V1LTF0_9GAMM|nr:VOC family protein [Veronia nyctiphanis]RXJ74968.1 hypothetical protein CS022_00550 [Veronia nyctiphanis]
MNQPLSVLSLKASIPAFHDQIQSLTEFLGIDLSAYRADHLALRVNDEALAKRLHEEWATIGDVISENQINGRPIVVIKEPEMFYFGNWLVDCVELPYPGDKSYPVEGWEHVEFVIPSDAMTAEAFCDELLERFPVLAKKWDQLEALGIKVKLSSPAGEGERIPNPTVAFKGLGVCIKLHPVSLEDVIASER